VSCVRIPKGKRGQELIIDTINTKRGQELIIDTINTAFGTPFKRHYVQIKQNFGEKWAYPNGV
jgi:hypothetical protein